MSPALLDILIAALGETLLMVGLAGLASLVVGIPLAVLLAATDRGGILQSLGVNRGLGAAVNALRSLPFIILLVALIPLTRVIVGTSIGTGAAIVPLAVAGIPFYARIAEAALREVDRGLVEAATAAGATRTQIVRHVLLPEALPSLVAGFTVTLVALIGASAMAGAIGGGGLGDVAIRYGYQRFETTVMIVVVLALIALVCGVQAIGDRLARRLNHRL
jgi:D-methionine transport system permease protein